MRSFIIITTTYTTKPPSMVYNIWELSEQFYLYYSSFQC